jgi:hypothetical protein
MKSEPEKLFKKHKQLVHPDILKVTSHVQRNDGDWILNTNMVECYDVPFRYKCKQAYKSIKGQRVNLTYYPSSETAGGVEFEVMNVVRIKIA